VHAHGGANTVETHVSNIFNKRDIAPAADDHRRVPFRFALRWVR
jgi:hypothetical protein